jgi:DNA modification methylase
LKYSATFRPSPFTASFVVHPTGDRPCGLRDYGTGLWGGGDPDCDHAKANAREPHERKSSTLGGGTDTIRVQEEANVYRDVCGKCGATRVDQQLGLEATPDQYVANMVDVFREVRRVLRRDGTCWVNLGDSYASGEVGRVDAPNKAPGLAATQCARSDRRIKQQTGLKPKDLVGIPWRVAFALQADGWYLRSDIVWSKPNPMPESVTDRPTKAHEYVFLLTRSPRYFFDADAVRETYTPDNRTKRVHDHATDGGHDNYANMNGGKERWAHSGRNIRSVWEIATQPYPEAHFATFPEALPERCIKAGTSERGCCPVCGAPWEREVENEKVDIPGGAKLADYTSPKGDAAAATLRAPSPPRYARVSTTTLWRPTCVCAGVVNPAVPCTVLDPFMGSGTTALVARRLGRRSIGVELNPEYAALCARRLQQLSLLSEVNQ